MKSLAKRMGGWAIRNELMDIQIYGNIVFLLEKHISFDWKTIGFDGGFHGFLEG